MVGRFPPPGGVDNTSYSSPSLRPPLPPCPPPPVLQYPPNAPPAASSLPPFSCPPPSGPWAGPHGPPPPHGPNAPHRPPLPYGPPVPHGPPIISGLHRPPATITEGSSIHPVRYGPPLPNPLQAPVFRTGPPVQFNRPPPPVPLSWQLRPTTHNWSTNSNFERNTAYPDLPPSSANGGHFTPLSSGPRCDTLHRGAEHSVSHESKHSTGDQQDELLTSAIPFHPSSAGVISFKKDQQRVDAWLALKLQTKNCDNTEETKSNIRPSKLSEVHRTVAQFQTLLTDLRQGCQQQQSDSVQNQLDIISATLQDPSYQATVRQLVTRRRKKRQKARGKRQRRQQLWRGVEELIDQARRLADLQDRRQRREAELRQEADEVLREVKLKQSEASALLALLAKLRLLRQHRLNKGEQHGYLSTEQHDLYFAKITDGLQEMVESQLREYSLEQRTLQAMLDQHNCRQATGYANVSGECGETAEKETSDVKKVSETVSSTVRQMLFGELRAPDPSLLSSYCAADSSAELLLQRRRAWDKFLVQEEGHKGASGVPVNWVLPPFQPSELWAEWSGS